MVQINFAHKEIQCKIVYYGPGMSGKTTNLEQIHRLTDPGAMNRLMDRTIVAVAGDHGSEDHYERDARLDPVAAELLREAAAVEEAKGARDECENAWVVRKRQELRDFHGTHRAMGPARRPRGRGRTCLR